MCVCVRPCTDGLRLSGFKGSLAQKRDIVLACRSLVIPPGRSVENPTEYTLNWEELSLYLESTKEQKTNRDGEATLP